MRDCVELVKALKLCPDTCRGCPRLNTSEPFAECKAKLNRDAADAIVELLAAVPKWISVEERLPENDGCYIVAVKNDHKRRYSKTAYFSKANWFAKQDVTHWMPLPESPKED